MRVDIEKILAEKHPEVKYALLKHTVNDEGIHGVTLYHENGKAVGIDFVLNKRHRTHDLIDLALVCSKLAKMYALIDRGT